MMKLTLTVSLSLIVFFGKAQTRSENTLLWRISGKGMSKPSFLFGTMHVNDKKAFNFKDSLYLYLEQADAFAMEFHPDSANSIISAYMDGDLSSDNGSIENELTQEQVQLLQKKIKSLGFKGNRKSRRAMLDFLLGKVMTSDSKETAMETFMDAFLYDMARRAGKEIFGLEQLQDQVSAFKSLSSGVQVKDFVDFIKEWDFSKGESPVHSLYYRENIDSIERFFKAYFNAEALDIFLYRRNIVMANGIEDLMKTKTVFAAVGAGHLPGKEGVIELLRKKGYTLEPVHSSRRMPASDYKFKTAGSAWQTFSNSDLGLEYQLLGKPTVREGTHGREVIYYYDLAGGMLYMLITGPLTVSERKQKGEDVARSHLTDILGRSDAFMIESKPFSRVDFPGLEALSREKKQGFFRSKEVVTNDMFYMLSVSAPSKDNVYNAKAEHFFNSFKFSKLPETKPVWESFRSKDDGFSVQFPFAPKVKPQKQEKEDESTMQMNNYSSFDRRQSIEYTITTGKTIGGNGFFGKDYFFESYLSSIKQNISQENVGARDTVINGFAAKKVITESYGGRMMEALIVKRDNRSYFVIAEFDTMMRGHGDIRKFFNSFALQPFPEAPWSVQSSSGSEFSTWVPSPITKMEEDTTKAEEDRDHHYYAQDPYSSAIYLITKSQLNKYYWATNLDSIYSDWKNRNLNSYSDSLVSFVSVRNGNLQGRELVKVDKKEGTVSRLRFLLTGKTMFILSLIESEKKEEKKNAEKFLSGFKIKDETDPLKVISSGPELLFQDLQSKDSATFSKAYNSISLLPFEEKDLLLLIEYSLRPYRKAEEYYQTVSQKLLNIAEGFMDKATAEQKDSVYQFVQRVYASNDPEIKENRMELLTLVATGNDRRSFGLVKDLLAQKIPGNGEPYYLFRMLRDTLQLSKDLFPEMLHYVNDSIIGLPVIGLTRALTDSNHISKELLIPYQKSILKLGQRFAGEVKTENDYSFQVRDLIHVLGIINNEEADVVINSFLSSGILDLQEAAAITLLKNDKKVDPKILSAIAADKMLRVSLYEDLKAIGREKFFPYVYRSQKSLSESYLMEHLVNQDEVDQETIELRFIKRVEEPFKTGNKRFYLFEVIFNEQSDSSNEQTDTAAFGGKTSHLAVVGPFDKDESQLLIQRKEEITGVYYEEKFNKVWVDRFFKKYLEEFLRQED